MNLLIFVLVCWCLWTCFIEKLVFSKDHTHKMTPKFVLLAVFCYSIFLVLYIEDSMCMLHAEFCERTLCIEPSSTIQLLPFLFVFVLVFFLLLLFEPNTNKIRFCNIFFFWCKSEPYCHHIWRINLMIESIEQKHDKHNLSCACRSNIYHL